MFDMHFPVENYSSESTKKIEIPESEGPANKIGTRIHLKIIFIFKFQIGTFGGFGFPTARSSSSIVSDDNPKDFIVLDY